MTGWSRGWSSTALQALVFVCVCVGMSTAALAQPAPALPDAAKESQARRPRVALVLSGGGARGGAHIGVLKVLEELRVPVDFIVGTSAGSIVGAAYATGMPLAEIEREMGRLNTAMLFRDVDRADVPLRTKVHDNINYIGPEMGIRDGGLALPKGAVAGVSMEAVLRRLTHRQQVDDFDKLPIPFRAVATDLTTSEMVVLRRGNLAVAIRASMAIPAVVDPVELDGRLLVDGGPSRNLPVDVARAMGADIIIAVNIGTPLLKRDEIRSLLSVSDQMTRILTNSNVAASIKEIRPNDVLLTPDLGTVATADFDRLSEAAAAGEVSARAAAATLSRFAVDAPTYQAWLARGDPATQVADRPIDAIRVHGTKRVNPDTVIAAINSQIGKPFDPVRVDADLKRIYAHGDFERVAYTVTDEPGVGRVLTAQVTEKAWGPTYLRFGLGLSTDLEGNAIFNLSASHRATWLNALGGEWRNDLQIGHTDRLTSEWYQPLTSAQRVFVAARVDAAREPFDVYDDFGQRVLRYRRQLVGVGADVGTPIGRGGELRVGLVRGKVKLLTDTGIVRGNVISPDAETGGVLARLRYDTLDSLHFPRSGYAGELRVFASRPAFGADEAYTKGSGTFLGAKAWGPHSVQLGLRGAKALGNGDLPIHELYSLGGFLNLSGYKTGQFLGRELAFGRLIYNYRLSGPGLFDGAYFGASAEVGRIGDTVGNTDFTAATRQGYSLYLSLDTPLGPAYAAFGRSGDGKQSVYLYLGQP